MRTTRLISGVLAASATSALIGLGTAPAHAQTPDPSQPGVTHERGIVLGCTGRLGQRAVLANLYENRTYGNFLEIQVGEGDGAGEVNVSRQVAKRFVVKGRVRAHAVLAHHRVAVRGTAVRTSHVTPVHEVVEDAGLRIVSDGTHTRLRTKLTLIYGKRATKLACSDAFVYDLTVTKTSLVD
ncbi:hypothetical protein [Nocardioides sp. URHA0020]|uniref:hypothetical protein n=1 Tax=Nocardioides sp. URHA0020 TaxID=1380392 RepID=UPI00048A5870|nr:hypothetical protein [Nocardioides sp. URHA0020]